MLPAPRINLEQPVCEFFDDCPLPLFPPSMRLPVSSPGFPPYCFLPAMEHFLPTTFCKLIPALPRLAPTPFRTCPPFFPLATLFCCNDLFLRSFFLYFSFAFRSCLSASFSPFGLGAPFGFFGIVPSHPPPQSRLGKTTLASLCWLLFCWPPSIFL